MNISDDDNNFSYRILFERVFDPIALYRIDGGRIVFEDVNPAYERVMKVSRDEVTGLTFDEVWPDSEPRWQQVITECLAQNRTMHCIGESVDTDSYLEAVAFPIPPGRAAVIFLDRTRLKKSDEALRKRQRQLQALAAKLTITEEATRRAIASDLHDRVGYELVNHLTILRSINSSGIAGEFRAKIQELMTITERIIAENRSLIFELSPPVLKEAGLTPALEELAENILTPAGVHWQIITKGNPDDLEADDSVCVILYRSARELLINAVKHSGASEVSIIINTKPELLTVAVEDNGKGFGVSDSEDGSAEGNGFGLFSVRERLRALGGELRIVSEPNKGAMLIMSCPRKLKYGEFTQ
ncbi:MAG: PAS domain-containing protein [Synergistaceae bacterium]|nr:PAS domain-containing protein [Synergistaceae bacterium]